MQIECQSFSAQTPEGCSRRRRRPYDGLLEQAAAHQSAGFLGGILPDNPVNLPGRATKIGLPRAPRADPFVLHAVGESVQLGVSRGALQWAENSQQSQQAAAANEFGRINLQ